eukprot:TRINITY_DN33422_c0_g1_i1.p1 TRINITY_DN33422_c0_g1~~TRINITY_DN33422_c0_g1_i1.p1  ORF type:complete len:370 (+),score=116.31 TRINITY_DN33422_c0_g1_i1:102-1211(+)
MSKPYSSMLVSPSRLPAESPLRRSLGIHLRSSGNGSLSHSTPFHRKTSPEEDVPAFSSSRLNPQVPLSLVEETFREGHSRRLDSMEKDEKIRVLERDVRLYRMRVSQLEADLEMERAYRRQSEMFEMSQRASRVKESKKALELEMLDLGDSSPKIPEFKNLREKVESCAHQVSSLEARNRELEDQLQLKDKEISRLMERLDRKSEVVERVDRGLCDLVLVPSSRTSRASDEDRGMEIDVRLRDSRRLFEEVQKIVGNTRLPLEVMAVIGQLREITRKLDSVDRLERESRLLKGELQKQDQEYQRKIEILQGKMEKDHRHLERRLEKEKMALNIAAKYLSDDQMKRVHREFEEARQSSPANSVASPRSIH